MNNILFSATNALAKFFINSELVRRTILKIAVSQSPVLAKISKFLRIGNRQVD